MSEELFHTSAPRGVRPGTSGFCTVAMTSGLSPTLEDRLTLLSGYRWIFPGWEPDAMARNPVSWAHWLVDVNGKAIHVLSRVSDAGIDPSRRSNRFAHHLLLETSELVEAGPAWVLRQPGIMESSWSGDPRIIDHGRFIPSGANPPRVCHAWARVAGDAGWGGVLAESHLLYPKRLAWLIFPPGANLLELLDESLALIPPARRWEITFNTYFTDLPAGVTCGWRGCPAGSHAASEALRNPGDAIVLDLTRLSHVPPDSLGALAARAGEQVGASMDRSIEPRVVAIRSAQPGGESVRRAGLARVGPQPVAVPTMSAPAPGEDWMPPSSATIVEYASVRKTPRPYWVGWAVAVGCMTLVAIAVLLLLGLSWQTQAQQAIVAAQVAPSPPVPAPIANVPSPALSIPAIHVTPSTMPADDPRLIAALAQVAELKVQKQALATSLKSAQISEAIAERQKALVDALTAELRKARAAAAGTPTSQPAPALPPPLQPNVLDDGFILWRSVPAAPAADCLELLAPPVPAGITVATPDAAHIAIRAAGQSLTVSPAGAVVSADLATVGLKDGILFFEWKDKKSFRAIDGSADWLGLSRIRILRQKQELGVTQPVAPSTIRLNLPDVVAILPDMRGADRHQLSLDLPESMPAGWTVEKQQDALAVRIVNVSNSALSFEVFLELSGPVGTARATWRDRRSAYLNRQDQLQSMDHFPTIVLPIRFTRTGAELVNLVLIVDHPRQPGTN